MENNKFVKPKKDFSQMMQDPYVSKWIENYKADKQSRLSLLNQFCEFIHKTPEELVLEHHKDRQSKTPLDITDIAKKQMKKWFEALKEKGVSHNAARQYVYSKLASFYARNKVRLEFEKGEIPSKQKGVKSKIWIDKSKGKIQKADKKEVLKRIRNSLPTLRDRTILLCKISSGLDDVDLFNLDVKDYNEGLYSFEELGVSVCYVEGYRIKPQGNPYYQTFFNSEAIDMISIYLKHRKEKGETVDENSKLFVSERGGGKIKSTAFSESLRKTCESLNLKNITPKRFRAYFSTLLGKVGGKIAYEIKERMMGHVGDVSKEYQEIFDDPEDFSKLYAEHVNSLTILGNGNAKYQKLDTEVQELKERNQELEMKMQQMITAIYMIKDSVEKGSDLRIELALENIGKPITEKPIIGKGGFDKDGKPLNPI